MTRSFLRAGRAPDRTFLVAPEEQRQWTYGQILADSERVAGGLRAGGAAEGDRVVIMAANSSRFVRTWLGCGLAHLRADTSQPGPSGRFHAHTRLARSALRARRNRPR